MVWLGSSEVSPRLWHSVCHLPERIHTPRETFPFQPLDEFCKNTGGTTADNCAANTTDLNSLGSRILGVKYWWKQHWQQSKKQEVEIENPPRPGLVKSRFWRWPGDDQELKNKRWPPNPASPPPPMSLLSRSGDSWLLTTPSVQGTLHYS